MLLPRLLGSHPKQNPNKDRGGRGPTHLSDCLLRLLLLPLCARGWQGCGGGAARRPPCLPRPPPGPCWMGPHSVHRRTSPGARPCRDHSTRGHSRPRPRRATPRPRTAWAREGSVSGALVTGGRGPRGSLPLAHCCASAPAGSLAHSGCRRVFAETNVLSHGGARTPDHHPQDLSLGDSAPTTSASSPRPTDAQYPVRPLRPRRHTCGSDIPPGSHHSPSTVRYNDSAPALSQVPEAI